MNKERKVERCRGDKEKGRVREQCVCVLFACRWADGESFSKMLILQCLYHPRHRPDGKQRRAYTSVVSPQGDICWGASTRVCVWGLSAAGAHTHTHARTDLYWICRSDTFLPCFISWGTTSWAALPSHADTKDVPFGWTQINWKCYSTASRTNIYYIWQLYILNFLCLS